MVHRPRLVELTDPARLVLVEAPSGAGKSTLLAQLAAAHDGLVLEATLSGTSVGRGQLLDRLRRSLRLRGLSDLDAGASRAGELDLLGILV